MWWDGGYFSTHSRLVSRRKSANRISLYQMKRRNQFWDGTKPRIFLRPQSRNWRFWRRWSISERELTTVTSWRIWRTLQAATTSVLLIGWTKEKLLQTKVIWWWMLTPSIPTNNHHTLFDNQPINHWYHNQPFPSNSRTPSHPGASANKGLFHILYALPQINCTRTTFCVEIWQNENQ